MATIRTAIQLQDRMTPALRGITTALNVTINSFEALQRASHNSVDTASLATARRELASAEVAINQVEQEIREANNAQQQFNRSVSNGGNAMGGLVNKVKNLATAYLGAKAMQEGMNAVDTYSSNKARLGLIVEEPSPNLSAQDAMNVKLQETKALQNQIFEAAQRSRSSYDAMQQSVAKLGLLAGKSFNGTKEIVAFNELMQKAFKVSGASTTEAKDGMYQLTQAMASGRLQGDEFSSIIENAPMLANAIAEYTGVGQEGLKKLSSDGAISANIIKASLFSAADDIESKYAQLPITFGDIWTDIVNTVKKQSEGLMDNVSKFINSDTGATVVNGIKYALVGLISALGIAIGMIQDTGQFFIDNWSMIAPIVYGVAAAYGIYTAALVAHNAVMAVSAGLEAISALSQQAHAAAAMMQAGATFTATAAQYGFNAALLACPITWIIMAIITLIAIIYAAVGAINHLAGTSYSATGFICGVFAAAGAFIGNLVIGLINWVIGNGVMLYNLIASFANFFGNVFNNPVAAIAHLFADLFDNICAIVQNAAGMIDALLGSNISGAVAGFRADVQDFVNSKVGENKVEVMKKLDAKDYQLDRFEYGSAYNAGYKFGQGVDKKIGSDFKSIMPKIPDPTSNIPDYSSMANKLGNIGDNTGKTAKNTGKAADKLEATDEDLKYLRDLAEQEVVNRFTTAKISLDMTNHNTINNGMDIDGIVDAMADKLNEAMEVAAEGVH